MLLNTWFVRIVGHKKKKQREMFAMNRNRQQLAKQAAEAHRVNIQKNIQHRLEVAKAQGDERLIRQLEAELNYCN